MRASNVHQLLPVRAEAAIAHPQAEASVTSLPKWKEGASAYERLSELAMLAREHPERFRIFCLVYRGVEKSGNWRYRTHAWGVEGTPDIERVVGLLQFGQKQIEDESAK